MKAWHILCAWFVLVIVLSLGAFKLGYVVHTLDRVRDDTISIDENVQEMKWDVARIQQKINDLSDKLDRLSHESAE